MQYAMRYQQGQDDHIAWEIMLRARVRLFAARLSRRPGGGAWRWRQWRRMLLLLLSVPTIAVVTSTTSAPLPSSVLGATTALDATTALPPALPPALHVELPPLPALPPRSVFPVGWFSSALMGTSESFPPAPFTVVVKYWNNNPPENGTDAVLRYLDQAQSRGVSVVLELPRRWVVATGCASGPCVAAIGGVVSSVCRHGALSGWYMADEPDKRRSWISPGTLTAVSAAVRAAEASAGCTRRPITAAFATLQEPGNASAAQHYNRSVDVYMWDKYPCHNSVPGWHAVPYPPFGGDDFASFPSEMRAVGNSIAPQFQSFWFVMQGSIIASAEDHGHSCNATKCWSAGWRECYPPELRYQVWAGLLGTSVAHTSCRLN
jgi:hypothetical protein